MAATATATIPAANRLVRDDLRGALKPAFNAMWTIEGEKGIFAYVQGCKANYEPKDGEVIANVNNLPVIFKRDEIAEEILRPLFS